MKALSNLKRPLAGNKRTPDHHITGVTTVLLAFFFVLSFSPGCRQEKKTANQKAISQKEAKSIFGDITCNRQLSGVEQETIKAELAEIVKKTSAMDYCQFDYKPEGCGQEEIKGDCAKIYRQLDGFLKSNAGKLTFCINNNTRWLAAVNLDYSPTHIYLGKKFFQSGRDEKLRSLVHEIDHLAGNNDPHTDENECEYYQNAALKAEHCLTCQVTFGPVQLSKCSSKNKIFIIQK